MSVPRRDQREDRDTEAVPAGHFRERRPGQVHLRGRVQVRGGRRLRVLVQGKRALEQQQKPSVHNRFVSLFLLNIEQLGSKVVAEHVGTFSVRQVLSEIKNVFLVKLNKRLSVLHKHIEYMV